MTFMNPEAIGTTAIILGATGGALTVTDWLISARTREHIKDLASTFWLWLSYQTTWPLIRRLKEPQMFTRFFFLSTTLLSCFFILGPAIMAYSEDIPFPISMGSVGFASALIIVPWLFFIFFKKHALRSYLWFVAGDSAWRFVMRGMLAYFVVLLFMFIIIGSIVLPATHSDDFLVAMREYYFIFIPLFFSVWFLAYVSFIVIYVIVFIMLYVLSVYALIALFRISQFLILRILEYDRGPVLAVAVLMTASGTVLKAFAG